MVDDLNPQMLSEWLAGMSLPERARILNRIAHDLTICTRQFEAATQPFEHPATVIKMLIGLSELQHQLSAQIGQYMDGDWEEISWRAFTLRELELRFSRIVAALIVGSYWAIWHIPLWLVTLNLTRDLVIPVLLIASVNLVGWSITFAFLYNQSARSLPVVIVMHGMYAAVQNLVFATAPYRHLHLIVISAIFSVCLAIAIAKRTKRVTNSACSSGCHRYEPSVGSS